MSKSKQTKKALLSSVIALILCFSMLLGTTFAWFTDTVTSGINEIQAGNLDIELYHKNNSEDGKVNAGTKLFTDVKLWEPGAVAMEKLTIVNEGSLALKYAMSFTWNKATENDLNGHKLSDILKVAVLEAKDLVNVNTNDREAILEIAKKATNGDLKTFGISGELYPENATAPSGETLSDNRVAYVVIYWEPSENDNDYNVQNGAATSNGKPLTIELGVFLEATQLMHENDSFGPDYDAGTPWAVYADTGWYNPAEPQAEYTLYTPEELAGLAALVNGNGSRSATNAVSFSGVTIKLGGDIDLNNQPWTPIGTSAAGFCGTFDGQGNTVYNLVANGNNCVGLFGYALNGGNVKNLNIENAVITAHDYAGSVIGRGYTDIDNCHVNNVTVITTPYQKDDGSFDGGAKAGGVIGQLLEGSGNTVTNCSATNVTIYGFRDIGGVAGMIHNNNSASGNTSQNVTLGYVLYDVITGDKNENAGAVYGRVQATATVSPSLDSTENQNYALVYVVYDSISLKSFANAVNKYSNYERPFENETVRLLNDVDLGGMEWTPIGDYRFSANRFCGTFDGQGNTISNFKISKKTDKNDSNKSSYGFFGNMEGTVKNLTIENAYVKSYAYCGSLIGRLNSGTVENCHVKNSSVECTYWQAGGMVGQFNGGATMIDCTITDTKVTGASAIGGLTGPVTADGDNKQPGEDGNVGETATIKDCVVENCTVIQKGSFGSNYDKLFGAMFADLDADVEDDIQIWNCKTINTTVKNSVSNTLFNTAAGDIYINGVLYTPPKVVEFDGSIGFQEAVNSLKSGDTLLVAAGTYTTSGTFVIPAGVTIEGMAGAQVIFSQISSAQDNIFNCEGDVTIRNITFESNRKGYAVTDNTKNHDTAGNITLINCYFKGLSADKNWGVYKNLNGNLTIQNCTFENYNNAICGVNNGNGSMTMITGCAFININGEAIGYVSNSVPAEFEQDAIANNTGLTSENVVGY